MQRGSCGFPDSRLEAFSVDEQPDLLFCVCLCRSFHPSVAVIDTYNVLVVKRVFSWEMSNHNHAERESYILDSNCFHQQYSDHFTTNSNYFN